MRRLSDWDHRLAEYLAWWRKAPFAWGERDCCTFSAGAVRAVTGEDPMAEFRGAYSTRAGSARALREIGEGTLYRTLNAKFPVRPKAFAQRGDLAFHGGNVGVVYGAEALFIGAANDRPGLVAVPIADCTRIWSVG